ncbi:hypothetical protein FA95DRAFT_1605985 [Auriscalpium vulgare]|uniref:Uncharacterized protein n=1 Tax=Auriscalpium vulgare TaxID=40419 RepID=A0ACB8RUH5_9AGAM|nr:hypothetical protein FA95DRAFT_1605985 [Auriscalpium vulgare]
MRALKSFRICLRQKRRVSLPYDIDVEIIDWVYRSSQHYHRVDYNTLRACALVCKAWTAPAQRLLFRIIYSEKLDSPALLDALRHNALLGTYVRSLEAFHYGYAGYTLPFTIDETFTLLALCPNLSALSLCATGEPSDTIILVERMSGLCLQLKHLDIRVDHLQCALPFVRIWPDLQSLKVYISHAEHDVPDSTSRLKTPRRAAVNLGSPETSRWLLEAADTSALRDLEVSGFGWCNLRWMDALRRIPALENLKSLFLIDGALPSQDVITRFVRLETLVFALCPAEDVVLPQTLRHVGYHATTKDDVGRAPIRYLLQALQGLPVLHLVTATTELLTADLQDLTRACEDLHVDFELYSSYRMHRRMHNVDWI